MEDRRSSAIDYPQSAIHNPQSAIRNPQSAIRNPQSAIRNPQSTIHNPQSTIHNPQSTIHDRLACEPTPFPEFLVFLRALSGVAGASRRPRLSASPPVWHVVKWPWSAVTRHRFGPEADLSAAARSVLGLSDVRGQAPTLPSPRLLNCKAVTSHRTPGRYRQFCRHDKHPIAATTGGAPP